jgi:hypothetical protein
VPQCGLRPPPPPLPLQQACHGDVLCQGVVHKGGLEATGWLKERSTDTELVTICESTSGRVKRMAVLIVRALRNHAEHLLPPAV